LNLKQTFPLKRYKDFDSFFLTLRVNLYTKTNISTRNICLLLLAALQATPPSTKRRLPSFGACDGAPPSIGRQLGKERCEERSGDLRTAIPPTTPGTTSHSALACSPPSDPVDFLLDIRAKIDRFVGSIRGQEADRTRENSLSPEEYIGIHEARGLSLRAAVEAPTLRDRSSQPEPLSPRVETSLEACSPDAGPPLPDVERDLPPRDLPSPPLASTLAAGFHSADSPGKKAIRTQAKQGKITAAFERELRRIGERSRGHA